MLAPPPEGKEAARELEGDGCQGGKGKRLHDEGARGRRRHGRVREEGRQPR
jgi:hypothetical protein